MFHNRSIRKFSPFLQHFASCGVAKRNYAAPEERVLGLVDLVVVHAQDLLVHSGDGLDQTFVAGGQLELPEEAGAHAAGGGAAKSHLSKNGQFGI